MSYRRLFLYLLFGSFLGLVAVGVASRLRIYIATWSTAGTYPDYYVTLQFSTLSVTRNEQHTASAGLHWRTEKISEKVRDSFQQDYGYTGRFQNDVMSVNASPTVTLTYQRVQFPIWVPWLVFNGGAFAFTSLMGRRSVGGREKSLAERLAEEENATAGD